VKELILVAFFLINFLLVVWIFYNLIFLDRRVQRRVNYYFNIVKGSNQHNNKSNFKNINVFKAMNEAIREKLSNINMEKTELMLKSSGLELSAEEFVMLRWFLTVVTGGVFFFLFNNIIFLLVGGILGYITPKSWVKRKIKQRIEKFNQGLPDMISTIIGSLRSGYSFAQAFKTVVEECDAPVKDEIGLLLKEMNYGITMEDALNNLNIRMPSSDLELMIQAVLIQRQVGGNLAGVLEIILGTIRDRNRIQRNVRTLTSQGRLSGRVIGLLPLVLGLVIFLINPEYISILFSNPIGVLIISIGLVSGIIGFILINKLTKIEV
jgi:tight adherence protein B